MSTPYVGGDGVMYFESAWTDGSDIPGVPSWTELGQVIDVNLDVGRNPVNVASRASKWQKAKGGLKTLSCNGTYRVLQKADTNHDKLWTSLKDEVPILLAVMSGAIDTTDMKGFQFPALVFQLGTAQPLEDAVALTFNIQLAYAIDASGDEIDPTRLIAT